jgi:hypothetical protein
MFFGQDLHERRRKLSHKAGQMRERRESVARWRGMRPFVSTTGVELRLNAGEGKFALNWMDDIFEVDGTYLVNAAILTDQGIASQSLGGVLAGGAGAILGAVGAASTGAPYQPLRSIVVRLHLDVPNFEELDFTMWESPFSVRSRGADVQRAFESAEEFVRLCLSVR